MQWSLEMMPATRLLLVKYYIIIIQWSSHKLPLWSVQVYYWMKLWASGPQLASQQAAVAGNAAAGWQRAGWEDVSGHLSSTAPPGPLRLLWCWRAHFPGCLMMVLYCEIQNCHGVLNFALSSTKCYCADLSALKPHEYQTSIFFSEQFIVYIKKSVNFRLSYQYKTYVCLLDKLSFTKMSYFTVSRPKEVKGLEAGVKCWPSLPCVACVGTVSDVGTIAQSLILLTKQPKWPLMKSL